MKSVYVFLVSFVVVVVSGNVINDHGGRIMGGTTTSITDYPFAVSMLNELFNINVLSANGIILTSNTILSAARPYVNSDDTVQPNRRWRARVGSAYFASGGTVHEIAHITIHPDFTSARNSNDLAVLRTSLPFLFTSTVKQATLAHIDFWLPNNQAVVAVGWGLRRIGEAKIYSQLLNHRLLLMNRDVCRSALNEGITNDVICAMSENGVGPCSGSAGSALILNDVLLGIFSYNRECGNEVEPNVYVNVATHIYWISDVACGTLKTATL